MVETKDPPINPGFRQSIRAAFDRRRGRVDSRIFGFTVIVSIMIALYIWLSILIIPNGETREFNFVNERGTVTALSSILLAVGGAFSLVTFLMTPHQPMKFRLFFG